MNKAKSAPILQISKLSVQFSHGGGLLSGTKRKVHAVDNLDLELQEGECLGLVGESGCGKSTLALTIMGLQEPTSGQIIADDQDINKSNVDRKKRALFAQIVFQDPYSSLNPRQLVRTTLEAPLRLHGVTDPKEREQRVAEVMKHVGLRPNQADQYPHEFSGGQRQRIGIARALILRPKVIVLDEPVSALDVSIRAQIINLLLQLKESLGLSYIMISHDLSVVEYMCDRVAVMYLGRIVEIGEWRQVFTSPSHPYTRGLIAAIPDPYGKKMGKKISGEIPNPLEPPQGCHFHPRCPEARPECSHPHNFHLEEIVPGHKVRCIRASQIS